MKKGGGANKGASFERAVAVDLSLWISDQARKDLFRRNILSGGRFTTAAAKGEIHGVPGDLAINHPAAAAFSMTFSVECKHYAKLDWDAFLYRPSGSFLHQVIDLCRKQAKQSGLQWIIIAKQNNRHAMAIMESELGFLALECHSKTTIRYHVLHNSEYMVMPFEDLLTIEAASFITKAGLCF